MNYSSFIKVFLFSLSSYQENFGVASRSLANPHQKLWRHIAEIDASTNNKIGHRLVAKSRKARLTHVTQNRTYSSYSSTQTVTPSNSSNSRDYAYPENLGTVNNAGNSTGSGDSSALNSSDDSNNSASMNTYQNYTSRSGNSETNSSSSSNSFGLKSGNLQTSGVFFGFLPDDGDAGGTRETMAELNAALGARSSTYGWYAQAHSGTPFDGSQLLAVIEDVKKCDCVFQPAVMPTGGWQGLTSSDNSQAVAIAKVMKKFTDEGIPVWLRFAHEANFYQTDGTYTGTAEDFLAGWDAVAKACRDIAPEVKMWWTPNVAKSDSYKAYAPADRSTVHLVGIDYYPKSLSTGSEFVTTMKEFHDEYAVGGTLFAIGETGLGYAGSESDREDWLAQVTGAKSQLPNFISASWFNYQKEYDYRIVTTADANITTSTKRVLMK